MIFSEAAEINKTLHPDCSVTVEITNSYRNMREKVEPFPHIIELALQAMRDCGIEPVEQSGCRVLLISAAICSSVCLRCSKLSVSKSRMI